MNNKDKPAEQSASEGDEWLTEDDFKQLTSTPPYHHIQHFCAALILKYGKPSEHIGKAAEAMVRRDEREKLRAFKELNRDQIDLIMSDKTSDVCDELAALRDEIKMLSAPDKGRVDFKHLSGRSEDWYITQIQKLKIANDNKWEEIEQHEQQLAAARAELSQYVHDHAVAERERDAARAEVEGLKKQLKPANYIDVEKYYNTEEESR
jgi:hypothetical protein